jgi:hypothetical protein
MEMEMKMEMARTRLRVTVCGRMGEGETAAFPA